jgi:preprotein translocase subunit SecB
MANFKIISQFLKDISFESPNVPELFFKNEDGQPKVEINIDIQVKGAENNLFMVDLITKVHSKFEKGEKTMFLIESTYSCLAQLEEEKNEDAKKRTLLIDVPTLIFPSVRALITRLTSESGFPPLALQPMDFAALYEQKNAK